MRSAASSRIASLGARIESDLDAEGYAFVPHLSSVAGDVSVLDVARVLGSICLLPGSASDYPIIETQPNADATHVAPFDRAEAIGWHNDFSTHELRPSVSLAYLDRADPRGPQYGAWRVASCDRILEDLRRSSDGTDAIRFLTETALPYSFTGEGVPLFFRAIERRGPMFGRLAIRFYGRAMRDGARLAYGQLPDDVLRAILAVEAAADRVGRILNAASGALLVTDNWHSLHDRLVQTVDLNAPRRRSLLCFVDRRKGEHNE